MNSGEGDQKKTPTHPPASPDQRETSPRGRQRARARKRKRRSSGSSSEEEATLPASSLAVERRLQETAERNNLSDESVKKILKKVVTNDHVLALVKLREEEEARDGDELRPKLTRAKAKELTKMSPTQAAPWTLELTPIKHIPVKTRPEVTALIAHDMPDESDEEYQLTTDDVLSDDDPALESCSDVDSQPRTPATPGHAPASPVPEWRKDGPFKIPEVRPGGKARRDSEEGPTIARRTRSKLCLSATPIESIERSFVPPDEVAPLGEVDDLWSNFLEEMLDPTPSQNEEDDETDPEYNVAADPDAYDEDEEALERSLVNISKKEIDDLFHELMCIGEEAAAPPAVPAPPAPGKQEPSPKESEMPPAPTDQQLGLEAKRSVEVPRLPIPIPIKEEVMATETEEKSDEEETVLQPPAILHKIIARASSKDIVNIMVSNAGDQIVEMVVRGPAGGARRGGAGGAPAPARVRTAAAEKRWTRPRVLRSLPAKEPQLIDVVINDCKQAVIEPNQMLILEQQLRQHVQLATSNFLQLYAHPRLWTYAPIYKDYLTNLTRMADERAADGRRSVVDVCNLRPALDLLHSWERTLSEDTPRNREMVQYLEAESEKCMKRNVQNVVYVGTFHDMLMEVVANSSVFLYPYLLPAVPFRCDSYRRNCYLYSEDSLIAMGLEQFNAHLHSNRTEYVMGRKSVTLVQVVSLIVQHMLPWFTPRSLRYHIGIARTSIKHRNNPIRKYFEKKIVQPVKHKLLSYNPKITLYEHPEYEMPLQWVKFISKHSQKAKDFTMKKARLRGHEPAGVDVDMTSTGLVTAPTKLPMGITQTQDSTNLIIGSLSDLNTLASPANGVGNTEANPNAPLHVLRTQEGGFLVPVVLVPQGGTVDSTHTPIPSAMVSDSVIVRIDQNSTSEHRSDKEEGSEDRTPDCMLHCPCCLLMRDMSQRWPLITNYFKSVRPEADARECCVNRRQPRISRRLRYFLLFYKMASFSKWRDFNLLIDESDKITSDKRTKKRKDSGTDDTDAADCVPNEMADEDDMEDRLWVSRYVNQVARVPNAARNTLVQLLKNFDPECDSPIKLYEEIARRVGGGAAHAAELAGLLTAAQADALGLYSNHFLHAQLRTFLALAREELRDDGEVRVLLRGVQAALAEGGGGCELCCRLLRLVPRRRRLAAYLYRAAPHSRPAPAPPAPATPATFAAPATSQLETPNQKPAKKGNVNYKDISLRLIAPKPVSGQPLIREVKKEAAIAEDAAEADDGNTLPPGTEPAHTSQPRSPPPTLQLPNLDATPLEIDTPELTVSKTEVEESLDGSQHAPSPDTTLTGSDTGDFRLKMEPVDWSREEDKVLLEAMQARGGGRGGAGLDGVTLASVQSSLADKSEEDIRERIDYLLQLLFSNGCS